MAGIRYHLDENMPRAVAVGLRQRGIDVTTTPESGLMEALDQTQLAFAVQQGRVFVTRDHRILTLPAQGISHAGIVLAPQGRRTIGPTILALVRLHRNFEAEDMDGRIEFV